MQVLHLGRYLSNPAELDNPAIEAVIIVGCGGEVLTSGNTVALHYRYLQSKDMVECAVLLKSGVLSVAS